MLASDYAENKLVDHLTGKTSFTMPTVYLALFTVPPKDDGTGGTEATYTSYARKQTAGADWNAASGGSASNANALAFPAATGGTNTIVAFGAYDALTVGNLLYYGPVGSAAYQNITSITRTGATATITATAHGLANGDTVWIEGANQPEYNGVFTVANSAANTFDVTVTGTPATPATTPVVLRLKKVTPLAVSNGITPQFAAGQLTVQAF